MTGGKSWCDLVSEFGKVFNRAGTSDHLASEAKRRRAGRGAIASSPQLDTMFRGVKPLMFTPLRTESVSPRSHTFCGSWAKMGAISAPLACLLCAPLLVSQSGCGSDRGTSSAQSRVARRMESKADSSRVDEGQRSGEQRTKSADTALSQPAIDRDQEIEASEHLLQRGDRRAAEAKLNALLVRDPNDAEVIFRLATVVSFSGDPSGAIELLDSIPPNHPDAGLPALGQSADWCFELQRYREAERRYRRFLELSPEASAAHRQLAYLYNRQGRRHEAVAHIYKLCRQGDVRQDELHALIHLSDAMYTAKESPGDQGDRPYWPIGPEGEARRLFMENKYQQAITVLRPSLASGDQPASVLALFGRSAAEAQDDEAMNWWMTQVDQETQTFADYWAALGLMLLSQNRLEESGRALMEAIVRDPTDFRSINRLRPVLESLGQQRAADRFDDRFQALRLISSENNRIADSSTPNVEAMTRIAAALDSIDRRLEAALWRIMAGFHQQLPAAAMNDLESRFRKVLQAGSGLQTTAMRLCEVDRNQFPLPNLDSLRNVKNLGGGKTETSASRDQQTSEPLIARFKNVAEEIDLEHTYQVASSPVEKGFAIYQSFAGAVAILDYDLNGEADLYFAQGSGDPPKFVGANSNQLFCNHDSRLVDVTEAAAASEYRYSLGVTAGDWNQDGFPDIVVANIGANALLLNNGDGTFRKQPLDDRNDTTLMSASLAMADVTGDHLPDLYEVNYVHDPEIARRPLRNADGDVIESLKPKDFKPGIDRLIVRDAEGRPSFHDMGDSASAVRAGLGVVIGDFDHKRGNEIFVGNDVYANQLWRRSDDNRWVDVAMLVGCAYGFSGAKTASMGIAAGDFDRNGWLDFHITNFQDESVSHYLNDRGSYQDRNIQYGLAVPTRSVLGFGTQALDYDNDRDLDLVVTNGHIDDAIENHAPFEQPPQLFCNLGDRFELIPVADESGYWARNHLGRGLARLDWNRDGKIDFVVTHLGQPSALLVNRTANSNHWLQLSLKGVESERDAIGARVHLRAGRQEFTGWITAGDGFFSRNEPVLSFGLGDIEAVDQITIRWPSGNVQTITSPPIDQRLLIVENENQPFLL